MEALQALLHGSATLSCDEPSVCPRGCSLRIPAAPPPPPSLHFDVCRRCHVGCLCRRCLFCAALALARPLSPLVLAPHTPSVSRARNGHYTCVCTSARRRVACQCEVVCCTV